MDGITWKLSNTINSNYNSRYLNSIDGKRSINLLKATFGEEIVKKLGLKEIDPKEVTIKHYKKY